MAAYTKHDLGHCEAGTVVEVTPAQASNVFLLDEHNFGLYRRGGRFRGVGGPAAAGVPIRLATFAKGRWFAVVDLGGTRGTIRASVRRLEATPIGADITDVVPKALPAKGLLEGRR
jgi:Domain of unknown function (DUF1883)